MRLMPSLDECLQRHHAFYEFFLLIISQWHLAAHPVITIVLHQEVAAVIPLRKDATRETDSFER